MNSETTQNFLPPLIFIHHGDSPYLRYTLTQAVLSHPARPVWLIGDDTNRDYTFVRHVHHKNFSANAFAFSTHYLHLNGNHPSFELLYFQRWFILRDFMLLNNLGKAVYLDSDILLYDNLQDDWNLIGNAPIALCGVAPPAFINRIELLDIFCSFMERSYRDVEGRTALTERYRRMQSAGIVGGICDMTFWEMLREQLPEAVLDLSAAQPPGACHDRNIELSEGFKTEKGIKKIFWHRGQPYGHSHDGTTARFKSLHMQGVGKSLTGHFFLAYLDSLALPPAHKGHLRIVIDGVFFQYRVTGIARVWEEILRQWATMPIANRIIVLDRDGSCPKVEGLLYLTAARHDYNNLDSDQQLLQQICDAEGATLFISTYYSTPLTTPSLLVIHDCIPEALGADLREPAWQEKRHAIEYASCYCTVSNHTAHDLLRYYPETAQKPIKTIYNGVSDFFKPATPGEISLFKEQYSISKPYYLFVGPVEWYKNFAILLDAFKLLPNHEQYLIVRTRPEEKEPKTFSWLITTGRLSDSQLRAAYSGALALVYPSWYEGFGLPALEAMACGCPVISANNSSIPEVTGDAACLISPHDQDAMISALLSVQSAEIRLRMRQAGLERARKFSWTRTAYELLHATVMNGSQP